MIYRTEHPKPQFMRENWLNLNGEWQFEIDNEYMCGMCYTQLTDVEQDQNGLYTYDRKVKFLPEIIKEIISRKAAMED